jgi:nucleotide-binding universal stress UspA family protein
VTADVPVDESTILAVLAELRGARACLDAADAACMSPGASTVTALHVRVDPMSDIMPTEEILTRERQRAMELEAAREGQALHDVYAGWMVGLPSHVLSNWCEVTGDEAAEIKEIGKRARLTVMTNLSDKSRGHARKAFHTCLFETEKPLLVVPEDYERRDVRRILVAWKDTASGRRALDAAAPWLRQADLVMHMHVGTEDSPEREWAQRHLADLGAKGEVRDIPRNASIPVGRQIIQEASVFDADWLVAGAFHHGEIIERILGGATKTLLREAKLPIFFMH